jgi:hypothetical protein
VPEGLIQLSGLKSVEDSLVYFSADYCLIEGHYAITCIMYGKIRLLCGNNNVDAIKRNLSIIFGPGITLKMLYEGSYHKDLMTYVVEGGTGLV